MTQSDMVSMQPIKCDTCVFLGGRHVPGAIHIQSGVLPVDEPYATCLKRQYYVLEREVEKCLDYREVHEKIESKKGQIPYSYTTKSILALFAPLEWLSLAQIRDRLALEDPAAIRYLPLKIKSIVAQKQLKFRFGDHALLYTKAD